MSDETTWAGIKCAQCGHAVALLDLEHPVRLGEVIRPNERDALQALGRKGVECPKCGNQLRGQRAIFIPVAPPT